MAQLTHESEDACCLIPCSHAAVTRFLEGANTSVYAAQHSNIHHMTSGRLHALHVNLHSNLSLANGTAAAPGVVKATHTCSEASRYMSLSPKFVSEDVLEDQGSAAETECGMTAVGGSRCIHPHTTGEACAMCASVFYVNVNECKPAHIIFASCLLARDFRLHIHKESCSLGHVSCMYTCMPHVNLP